MKKININDKLYPKRLKEIPNPPEYIYTEGNIELLHSYSVAIIGSRQSSENGRTLAKKFAKELSQIGITVISGLARGIDTIAHNSSFDQEGKTIAVLGCGFNRIFPPENNYLYKKIIENGGLIISEYSPDTEHSSEKFPARNRIISGLSSGILVIEAKHRSGTTKTAEYAKTQNRPVFALPHEINNPHGVGTNRLLKNGAILVTDTLDILEKLHLSEYKNHYVNFKNSQTHINKNFVFPSQIQAKIYSFMSNFPISPNDLAKKARYSINEILSTLFILEMNGYIEKVEGGYVCTKIN